MSQDHPRSSRLRYHRFVQDYQGNRLDDLLEENRDQKKPADPHGVGAGGQKRGKARRQYLREYAHWLWPHRYTVAAVMVFALLTGGLEMVQPLFMRFIVDRVLLKSGLEPASRFARLEGAGAVFLGVIAVSNLIGALKDYRQRL